MSFEKNLRTPAIPMAYLQLMVEIMAEHGINVDALLKGTGIEPAQANQPDARMAAWQWGLIVYNAMELSDCRSLGYEYGLRMQLSVHGFLGYATMTSLSGEDAIKLLARYFRSRQRNLQLSWSIEDDACVAFARHSPSTMATPPTDWSISLAKTTPPFLARQMKRTSPGTSPAAMVPAAAIVIILCNWPRPCVP